MDERFVAPELELKKSSTERFFFRFSSCTMGSVVSSSVGVKSLQ